MGSLMFSTAFVGLGHTFVENTGVLSSKDVVWQKALRFKNLPLNAGLVYDMRFIGICSSCKALMARGKSQPAVLPMSSKNWPLYQEGRNGPSFPTSEKVCAHTFWPFRSSVAVSKITMSK